MKKPLNDLMGDPGFFKVSTYFSILGYFVIALLFRVFALSPLVVLWITSVGWSIKWVALFCPVLIILIVLPMRFSFARAMMAAAQGKPFSIRKALRLTRYCEKLSASFHHALRILCWGLPFFFVFGWLVYLVAFVDAFMALRTITQVGVGVSSFVLWIVNLFNGIFAKNAVNWEWGFVEGAYAFAGLIILTWFIFTFGIWRNSVYRYLWAEAASKARKPKIDITKVMYSHRRKQLVIGLYNLMLWLPTFFFTFLFVLGLHTQIVELSMAIFETKTLPELSFSMRAAFLGGIVLFFHVLIMPIRRIVIASFVSSFDIPTQ